MQWIEISPGNGQKSSGCSANFSSSGINFNATFCSQYLPEETWVRFVRDELDPYFLGIKVFNHKADNTNKLQPSSSDENCNGKTHKLLRLRTNFEVYEAACSEGRKDVPIWFCEKKEIFFVHLRPDFQNTIKFSRRTEIPGAARGIYRYLDQAGDVLYIGSGRIKKRAMKQKKRKKWNIADIQYTEITPRDFGDKTEAEDAARELAYFAETCHLWEHKHDHGEYPPRNKNGGKYASRFDRKGHRRC